MPGGWRFNAVGLLGRLQELDGMVERGVGVAGVRQCPECGGLVSPRSCDDLFQELLALDHSRRAPWGPLHGIAVACFFLQHSSRMPSAARSLYWAVLHAYMRDGLAAAGPMAERVRKLNSHRRGGRAPRAGDYPGAPPFPETGPPRDFATTIADVSADGSFPAAGHEERVRRWAADTVGSWQGTQPGRCESVAGCGGCSHRTNRGATANEHQRSRSDLEASERGRKKNAASAC